jgi:nickel transport protein
MRQQSVRSPRRRQAFLAALVLLAALLTGPAAAFDLFARHQVSVEFATADGKKLADAEVRVFAPGKPNIPVLTGRTDKEGKFEFSADADGFWTAEARAGGEIARATVRVGTPGQQSEPISPVWLIGGLLLLLIIAFGVRVALARRRRQVK